MSAPFQLAHTLGSHLETAIPSSCVRNLNIRAPLLTLTKGKQIYYYFFCKCFCWLQGPLVLQRQAEIRSHPAVPMSEVRWAGGGSRRAGNEGLGSEAHPSPTQPLCVAPSSPDPWPPAQSSVRGTPEPGHWGEKLPWVMETCLSSLLPMFLLLDGPFPPWCSPAASGMFCCHHRKLLSVSVAKAKYFQQRGQAHTQRPRGHVVLAANLCL